MSVQRLSLIYLVKELSGVKPEKNAPKRALFSEFVTAKIGGATRDRTADLLNANQALSQLSYSPVFGRPGQI